MENKMEKMEKTMEKTTSSVVQKTAADEQIIENATVLFLEERKKGRRNERKKGKRKEKGLKEKNYKS